MKNYIIGFFMGIAAGGMAAHENISGVGFSFVATAIVGIVIAIADHHGNKP